MKMLVFVFCKPCKNKYECDIIIVKLKAGKIMEIKELIGKNEIDKRLEELAEQLDNNYSGKEIVAICVLNGAVYFAAELTLKMKTKMQLEFVKISSYEGTNSSGNVKKHLDIDKSKVEGKNILIIEDIVDTGRSMNYLIESIKGKNPKDLKVCVLLNKPSRREVEVNIDYVGFEVSNKFIVGYGFDDVDGTGRNIPYIGYKEM